jgi:LPXTG-site transpeptidase (sortase) family protein
MDPKQPQNDDDSSFKDPLTGGLIGRDHKKTSGPPPAPDEPAKANPAADLVRAKLSGIYSDAPDTKEEIAETKEEELKHHKLSKHQAYMEELSSSGKSFAEIQTAWHEYYTGLSDPEKHEVWQEFYASNKNSDQFVPKQYADKVRPRTRSSQTLDKIRKNVTKIAAPSVTIPNITMPNITLPGLPKAPDLDVSMAEIKKQVISKVKAPKFKKVKSHIKSLLFGLGLGIFVIIVLLFSFFNEAIIAPFITPSQNVSAQSIIVDPSSIVPGLAPILIIPKINVQLPVVYTDMTTNEDQIENNLEDGVVHFPTTPYPGQLGNGVIFGHSANNILNPGKFKFAFVLLHDLRVGDTFYLEYQGKLFVYQIFQTEVVSPSDTSVLNATSKPATFTLITCDPPGTSINRLIVTGVQISPDPTTDTAAAINQNTAAKPAILPSNSPTLWSRLIGDLGL